nr:MAG TPA: Protein of unknown function (DUF2547) [Caudoviricetes sp.]
MKRFDGSWAQLILSFVALFVSLAAFVFSYFV